MAAIHSLTANSDPQLAQMRLPPHSLEAEQAVLGGLLLDNSAWDRIGDVVSESDFYRQDHRQILRAIVRQIAENRPADAVTVSEALQSMARDAGIELRRMPVDSGVYETQMQEGTYHLTDRTMTTPDVYILRRSFASDMLPNEGVMPGPVAGRRELMKSTRSNFEPILLVYNGGRAASGSSFGGHRGPADAGPGELGAASQLTDLTADSQEPLACAVTSDGVTHRLWAVTDPAVQSAVAPDLATRTALIADGHHRYAAYRGLQAEMRESGAGAGPWDYGLAILVDADAYPLRLGAIHRILPHLDPAEAARLAASGFTVTPVPAAEAMARLVAAGESGTAFLLAGEGGYWLLTDPDQEQLAAAMPPEASPRWQALDASVMQELLLAQLWSVKDNERDVLISHDADEAIGMAVESGGTAVICNPMALTAVMEIAAHGEKVPRKSTSFGPKPRTGLVLRTFDV